MTREQLLEGLQERMKKYALAVDGYTPEEYREAAMYADLQATVRALEVARDTLGSVWYSEFGESTDCMEGRLIDDALKTIDQTLGKAGV